MRLSSLAPLVLLALSAAPPAHATGLPDWCPFFLDGMEPVTDGTLMASAPGEPIEYLSRGGYSIKIDIHTITITDPPGRNTVQHWGDPHENLNGKHIKDWLGSQRSLLLGDGTRVTMAAAGPHGVVVQTSIYDGHRNVQVDNVTNTIVHTTTSLADTRCRETVQHDGETARFDTDEATGVATYRQIHTENEAFETTPDNQPLGTTGGFANPTQVNDLYDDPRLGHT